MNRKGELFRKEVELKFLLQVLVVPIIFALMFTGIYFLEPTITGFATGINFLEPTITGFATVTEQLNYTDTVNLKDTVNLEFAESSEYIWNLENPGNLKSVKIDGSKSKKGKAKVYIEKDGIRYLIFDSKQLVEKSSGIFGITGFAVNQEQDNNAPIWNSEVDSFSLNGTMAVDLSLYFYDEDNDPLIYSTSNVTHVSVSINNEIVTLIPDDNIDETKQITFAAFDGKEIAFKTVSLIINTKGEIPINETPTNETEKIIDINFNYGDNEAYDANNDGIESLDGAIDFTVAGTEFNWQVDEEKLCTRYEVYSVENEESTFLCYGNSECCAFVDLQSSREYWDDTLYMTYGSYGSAENSIVSAQVLSVDYNLSAEVPYSDIVYSEWADLTAKFVKDIIEFEDVCIDTCSLDGFNESSYKLIIEIENTILRIDEIKYTIEKEVYEEIVEPEEELICKDFEDNVLWSSGYSSLPKGSTNYETWNIGTNCTQAGGYNCTLQNLSIRTRSIYSSSDYTNVTEESYVQLSDPDESICDAPEDGVYSRYLAYETLKDEDIRTDWYCGKKKNSNAKCAIEIATAYADNVGCYGIKVHGSKNILVDVFGVKYTWCWDSTYNSENMNEEVNYGQ